MTIRYICKNYDKQNNIVSNDADFSTIEELQNRIISDGMNEDIRILTIDVTINESTSITWANPLTQVFAIESGKLIRVATFSCELNDFCKMFKQL